MSNKYRPRATWKRCIICGEYISADEEIVGGKVKHGGTRCAHRSCGEAEQAELSKEVRPCPSSSRKI